MPKEYRPELDDGQQLVVVDDLVPYEPQAESQPQSQPQAATFDEAQYMQDLDTFAQNCSNLDDFLQYARIVNVRIAGVPGSREVRGLVNDFANAVQEIANNANHAKVTESNRTHENVNQDLTEELRQARELFRPALQGLKQLMHQNWDHPGVQRTIETTKSYVERHLPRERTRRSNAYKNQDVYAAPGEGQKERQNALSAVYTYLTAVNEQSFNKHIRSVPNAKTEEEFFRRSYDRIAKNITKGIDPELAKQVPLYDVQKYGPYGDEKGKQRYCQDLDSFFRTAVQQGKPDVVKTATNRMVSGTEVVRRVNHLDSQLSSIQEMLDSQDYTREAKLSLLTQISASLTSRGYTTPKVSEEMDFTQWMSKLSENVQESAIKDRRDAKILLSELNTFTKEGEEHMTAFMQGSRVRDHYLQLKQTFDRSYSSEFEGLMGAMGSLDERMEAGERMTAGQMERVGSWAMDYCMRKVHQNKEFYDSIEATRLGRVIETLTELDPQRGMLMQDVFGMRITGEGATKAYSFRKIPESILQGTSSSKMTISRLEQNIGSYREAMESGQKGPELDRMRAISGGMIKNVKNADHALMRSSQQFRDFRRATQALADEMEKVQKSGTISPEKKQELLAMTKAVRDTARTYREYKQDGSALTNNAMKRLAASETVTREAEAVEDLLRAPDIKKAFAENPRKAIQDEVDYLIQNRDASPSNLAKIVFLKSAEKAIQEGQEPRRFEEIFTNPAKLDAQARKFEKSAGYDNLIRNNPDIKMGKPMTGLNPDKALATSLSGMNQPQKTQPQQNVSKPVEAQKVNDQPQAGGMLAGF